MSGKMTLAFHFWVKLHYIYPFTEGLNLDLVSHPTVLGNDSLCTFPTN